MAVGTAVYWKANFSEGKEQTFQTTDEMKNFCIGFFKTACANRARWKAEEGRWHDVIRFALACEEFFAKFDEDFDRQESGNILHLEIRDGLNPINISAMSYYTN